MEELITLVVNNGLGVASFIVLILYIFKYQQATNEILTKINSSQEEINKSQQQIQTTLAILSARIDTLESKIENNS